jgi:hypothetical protein
MNLRGKVLKKSLKMHLFSKVVYYRQYLMLQYVSEAKWKVGKPGWAKFA